MVATKMRVESVYAKQRSLQMSQTYLGEGVVETRIWRVQAMPYLH
jgi:hypothetical protein